MKEFEVFASEKFKEEYHYEKPLGAFCGPEGTRIYLWAPTAEAVFLHFYSEGDGVSARETIAMERGKKGVWKYSTIRNMDGWYYDFDVTFYKYL